MTARACFTFDNTDGEGAGYPEILALCADLGVTATCFLEGHNGEDNPSLVRDVVGGGHELGMHGWAHEEWRTLDPSTERDLASRATEALASAAGVSPAGFRAPGGARTDVTEQTLRDLGYRYDASLGDGSHPSRLEGGLPNVPFVWPAVDGYWYLRDQPEHPATVRDAWLAELDKAAADDGLFLLICHAFITGIDPARVDALRAVMEAALADGRVVLETVGEVAGALSP
jgi:peptidoglycan/xylan/chitin deacetylase (PgdA/CDA1 family)